MSLGTFAPTKHINVEAGHAVKRVGILCEHIYGSQMFCHFQSQSYQSCIFFLKGEMSVSFSVSSQM